MPTFKRVALVGSEDLFRPTRPQVVSDTDDVIKDAVDRPGKVKEEPVVLKTMNFSPDEIELLLEAVQVADKIVEQAAGLTIKYILATHGHPGHVGGKDGVKAATGGETGIHSADAKQFLRSADRYLVDGDELDFGDLKVQVLHTPGHTPGSLCFVIANHAFVGDTILAGGIRSEEHTSELQSPMYL